MSSTLSSLTRLARPWRSLTTRLTLAFLLVGVIGAVLVAILVQTRAQTEFSRYLSTRDQQILVDALGSYYAAHGGWDGVGEALAADPRLALYSRDFTLADAQHVVLLGRGPFRAGQAVPADLLGSAEPVSAGDSVVGYALFPTPPPD